MARLGTVDAVKLFMYENDHPPPHFHALFAEYHAVINIETLAVTMGEIPRPKQRAVLAWARPRRAQLLQAWALTQAHIPVEPFE